DRNHRAGRRAGLDDRGVQPPGAAAQPGAHRLGRHRCAAAAPARPGADAGVGGAGLRRPRARRAGGGDQPARAGAGRGQPPAAGPGGAGAGAGSGAAVRAPGGLPGPQGQRELRAAAARPGRGRGAPAVRAPLLQRRGARLQRRHPARARPAGRARRRLRQRGLLRGRRRAARRRAGGSAVSARLPVFAAVLLWLLACAAPLMAQERIEAYDIRVAVQADGSLEVTENLRIRAEGERIRRGIQRDFPTRYRDRYGNRVNVDFEVLEVLRDGRPEPWFTESIGNGVRVNTGNDDFLPVPASFTWTLRYRTTHQLGFFEHHDELYWNAIGTGWAFGVDSGSVEVRLPQPVPQAQLQVEGYTGAQGASGRNYAAGAPAPGLARWTLTAPLAPGEGLTVVLGFPKGVVAEPTRTQELRRLLADNRALLIAVSGLVVLLAGCIVRWRQVGRDPQPGTVVVRYTPPPGISPAGLRYIREMSYDTRCFTADVLALAVDGSLLIERDKGLLKDHWRLQRVGAAPSSAD